MKLYSTPLSHFSRKVRIIADLLNLKMDYQDIGNVAEIGIEKFAGNPLMGVPVLIDNDVWMIDSDNITSHLVRKYDHLDTYKVLSTNINDLNIRAVLNGIMSNEVRLIMGKRTGIAIDEYPYFQKAKLSIMESLKWIEDRLQLFQSEQLLFNQIHLVCAVDHLDYFGLVDISGFQEILKLVKAINTDSRIFKSHLTILKPKASSGFKL